MIPFMDIKQRKTFLRKTVNSLVKGNLVEGSLLKIKSITINGILTKDFGKSRRGKHLDKTNAKVIKMVLLLFTY